MESLNVSQELFFDAPTDLPIKDLRTQKAKTNISELRASFSVEELNVSERETTLRRKDQIESVATSQLVPMQSACVEQVLSREKEKKFGKPSEIEREKSDLSLIFQHSKNITEVLLSNKEGKLRTVKPSKTNARPKISTKEAVIVKQVSLDDSLEEFKAGVERPASIDQDLVQSCSLMIQQNERLESEGKYGVERKLDESSAKAALSESQFYLASIKDQATSEAASAFETSIDERTANVKKLKDSFRHLTVNEISTNEKVHEFKSESINLQTVKLDENLRRDQNLLVLEQSVLDKESSIDQVRPKEEQARPTIDSKNVLEINQPTSFEKELVSEAAVLSTRKASFSRDNLNELHISDTNANERETLLRTEMPESTKVLPIAQADQLANYTQQSSIAQLDERKAQGRCFVFIYTRLINNILIQYY